MSTAGRKTRARSPLKSRPGRTEGGSKRIKSDAGPGAASARATDEAWMRLALAEGERGLGRTSPNPAVGCVLVQGGRELSRGYYAGAGPHAEALALRSAGRRAKGATA